MPGPAFSNVAVTDVQTLPAGNSATVSTSFDGTTVSFSFGIPVGADGDVSSATLNAAIAGTSSSANAVGTLDTPFADPDAESIRQKLNELILALRRI